MLGGFGFLEHIREEPEEEELPEEEEQKCKKSPRSFSSQDEEDTVGCCSGSIPDASFDGTACTSTTTMNDEPTTHSSFSFSHPCDHRDDHDHGTPQSSWWCVSTIMHAPYTSSPNQESSSSIRSSSNRPRFLVSKAFCRRTSSSSSVVPYRTLDDEDTKQTRLQFRRPPPSEPSRNSRSSSSSSSSSSSKRGSSTNTSCRFFAPKTKAPPGSFASAIGRDYY
mmetsp:Transcript_11294/g.18171  ORF Transcript_11294/g.18171 Transcript_11294/m.18171 type:complete len:222 (-) Transcript_11294:1318-1983(-)